MYCKNCGNAVEQGAVVCTNCGVPVGGGDRFCANCGSQVQPGQAACLTCGFATAGGAAAMPGAKSKVAAGLLGIFLGGLGIHNFYLGYKGKAIAQLLITLLSCFMLSEVSAIWGLIEGIMLLSGSINTDADGNPLGD